MAARGERCGGVGRNSRGVDGSGVQCCGSVLKLDGPRGHGCVLLRLGDGGRKSDRLARLRRRRGNGQSDRGRTLCRNFGHYAVFRYAALGAEISGGLECSGGEE